MGDVLARDRRVDPLGLDPPQADMRAGERRDGPRKAPAVAVKHRQGPEIDRMVPHSPDEDVAERVQIGAAMVIDHALGVAGGARGVVESDRFPLVPRHHLLELRITGREKRFVVHFTEPLAARTRRVGNVDH
jgi:hypothetical protein